jgi:hypothetical protein
MPTADPSPDLSRVFWPLVHLIFAANPIGMALHVGEVLWAVAPLVGQRATPTTGADLMRDADVALDRAQATGCSGAEACAQTMNACARERVAPGA